MAIYSVHITERKGVAITRVNREAKDISFRCRDDRNPHTNSSEKCENDTTHTHTKVDLVTTASPIRYGCNIVRLYADSLDITSHSIYTQLIYQATAGSTANCVNIERKRLGHHNLMSLLSCRSSASRSHQNRRRSTSFQFCFLYTLVGCWDQIISQWANVAYRRYSA